MIREIHAKTILNTVPGRDDWFGLKYNMNLYRGCQHQCIYCDSRSACYQIENFADIQVKVNAIDLLEDALPRKRIRGAIGLGSMNDPYMPVERKYNLAGRALQVIARNGFPVHIITKSDLVLKDMETLRQVSQVYAAISFTITTADDDLSAKIEPGAPPSSRRFAAIRALAANGILAGITMMPILPFIEDTEENIAEIVKLAHENGATYILPWFGMSLREGSREYYYARLDERFPGLKQRYIQRYGNQYTCNAPNWRKLETVFREACERHGLAAAMPKFTPEPIARRLQPRLL
ncbi:MAG: radical SAM protein [Chloroflexi bacterium]|nr:radical SAM protein [Chloroflexota bacterium]